MLARRISGGGFAALLLIEFVIVIGPERRIGSDLLQIQESVNRQVDGSLPAVCHFKARHALANL